MKLFKIITLILFLQQLVSVYAAVKYASSTIAGAGPTFTGDYGPLTSAVLTTFSRGIWGDTLNNIYLTDSYRNSVRKFITGTNNITTIISDLKSPSCLWGNSNGIIYILNTATNFKQIIAVSTNTLHMKTIYAGTSSNTNSGDNGQATSASFSITASNYLWGDSNGNIYIPDSNTVRVIRYVDSIIRRFAGSSGSGYGGDFTQATSATLSSPTSIWGSLVDEYYIADRQNYRIRKVDSNGIMTTFAGLSDQNKGQNNMAATSCSFVPAFVYGNNENNALYVVDNYYDNVAKITLISPNIVSRIAGTDSAGTVGFAGDNGPAVNSRLSELNSQLYVDTSNNMYLADAGNQRIRSIHNVTKVIKTLVGGATYSGDGKVALKAQLYLPSALAFSLSGDSYIADSNNNRIRKTSAVDNIISTFMGTGVKAVGGTGGKATSTAMGASLGVWCDRDSNALYVADNTYHAVRKVDLSTSIVSLFVGIASNGGNSGTDGMASSARIKMPAGLWGDTHGDVFIAEFDNYCIRKVRSSDKVLLAVAGVCGTYSAANDITATAGGFGNVYSLWGDSAGNLYIADRGSTNAPRIRKMTMSTQMLSILVAVPDIYGIWGVGDVLYASKTCSIVRVAAVNNYVPVAVINSANSCGYNGDSSTSPISLSVDTVRCFGEDTAGRLYFAEAGNNVIRLLDIISDPTSQPSASPTQPTSQPSLHPTNQPSSEPSSEPTKLCPTCQPTAIPSLIPSISPSSQPSREPTVIPTVRPITTPSVQPTCQPSRVPTCSPSVNPSCRPLSDPSNHPSRQPSCIPSVQPGMRPTSTPSCRPSCCPSSIPSAVPSQVPSSQPSVCPSSQPTTLPSSQPSTIPSIQPRMLPSSQPSICPSSQPGVWPSSQPSTIPSIQPRMLPSSEPSVIPSVRPSSQPGAWPSSYPSSQPQDIPTCQPLSVPTLRPIGCPSGLPSGQPTTEPSMKPNCLPSWQPTCQPSLQPSCQPSASPSCGPSSIPSRQPRSTPTGAPSSAPSTKPSSEPTVPRVPLNGLQSTRPSRLPTAKPSQWPTVEPSRMPSCIPTATPTRSLPLHMDLSVIFTANFTVSFKIVLPFLFTDFVPVDLATTLSNIIVSEGVEGTQYVMFGGTYLNSSELKTSEMMYITSAASYDYSGRCVSNAGDVNGDGIDDLIIGVPFASIVYVLFGTRQGFVNMTEGFTILGVDSSDLTGWAVSSAGDVNNDTIADIVIGAPNAGTFLQENCGMVYVIYGKRASFELLALKDLVPTEGYQIAGSGPRDNLGISVSGAGDVNRDGCDDIIIGALKMENRYSGAAYIVFGTKGKSVLQISLATLKLEEGVSFLGNSFTWLGYSVSGAGDVNRDGYDDILIGSAPRRTSLGVSISYLIYGKHHLTATSLDKMTKHQGIVIVGGGLTVSKLGDINADGFDDVMMSGGHGLQTGGGLVLRNPSNTSEIYTRQPLPQPSVWPSKTPSVLPTARPSITPSCMPTRSPTQPTMTPSIAPTGPTYTPTATPTQPSSRPTLRPVAPSQLPTIAPSWSPSERPSIQPSEMPTVMPSETPSGRPTYVLTNEPTTMTPSLVPTVVITRSPSRFPVVRPTVMPTEQEILNITYVDLIITSGGVHQRLNETRINYVFNTTNDVVLNGGGGSWSMFTILPHKTKITTVIIERFNITCDKLNLQKFQELHSMSDLNISSVFMTNRRGRYLRDEARSEESVRIAISSVQQIFLLNVRMSDLSVSHFVFSSLTTDNTDDIITDNTLSANLIVKIVGFIVAGSLAIFLIYKSIEEMRKHSLELKLNTNSIKWEEAKQSNATYLSFTESDFPDNSSSSSSSPPSIASWDWLGTSISGSVDMSFDSSMFEGSFGFSEAVTVGDRNESPTNNNDDDEDERRRYNYQYDCDAGKSDDKVIEYSEYVETTCNMIEVPRHYQYQLQMQHIQRVQQEQMLQHSSYDLDDSEFLHNDNIRVVDRMQENDKNSNHHSQVDYLLS